MREPDNVRVDLHIHSTASDGRWTPDQLVTQAQDVGIGLLAVADHDTTDNVLPVGRRARARGISFIPAVEVSTTLDGHLFHLVGYGIDVDNSALQHILSQNRRKLASVDDQAIDRLIRAGYDISWEEFGAYEYKVTRGGWKALNYLIDRGLCRDVRDYSDRLFVGNLALTCPAFADPGEAVHVIHQAGGKTICAHPGHSMDSGGAELLDRLLALGVAGLECYSPYHDRSMTRFCLDYCRRHGLLITAGSDCHGGFVGRALGIPTTRVRDLNLGPIHEYVIH